MGSTAPPQLPAGLAESVANSKAEYVNLGKSGLRVSIPILGAMSFGSKKWLDWMLDDEEQVLSLLKAAYDRGLNSWDTANLYSNGESERFIAKAIKKFEIPRQKVLLMTKCFGTVGEQPEVFVMRYRESVRSSKDYVNQGGLSRAAIFNAVDASLSRLETSYIDLLQIHRFDHGTRIEETMEALHDLVKAGKVRYIGASSMWTYQFCMMQACAEQRGWTKFVSMQNQHSLIYREEEREMNKYCLETGVGLIPWAPLAGGYLARPLSATGTTARSEGASNATALSDADQSIINRVEELAGKKGWKMSQVALAWSVQKGNIPIVGFSKIDRIDESLEVRGKTLTEDEVKYLEEPYQPKNISGHS